MKTFKIISVIWLLWFVSAWVSFAEDSLPTTAIIGAMNPEVALLNKTVSSPTIETIQGLKFVKGTLFGRNVIICKSGIGKVNAAMAPILLVEHFKPKEVLLTVVGRRTSQDAYE